MSQNYGKLNFSTSFNPTSAFPLDARTYFTSLAEAENAAKSATTVGSSDSIYYYGQMIIVMENGITSWYKIGVDNTLIRIYDIIPLTQKDYDELLSLNQIDDNIIYMIILEKM